jgi:hypothetical protein
VLPRGDASAMQHHLNEISRRVAAGAHAVLILDKAGPCTCALQLGAEPDREARATMTMWGCVQLGCNKFVALQAGAVAAVTLARA